MELLFVTLGGLILGFLARYTLPHRSTNGVLLVPALGAAFSAALWVALTWAGLKWDAGLIWWITLVATAAVCAVAAVLLGRVRQRQDADRLATLTRARATR